jgi:translation initiation factor 2 subunit 3
MPIEEKHHHHDSDSESDDEEEIDNIPVIDVDVTKLTPLSPEVISKQVRNFFGGCKLNIKERT